MDKLTLTVQHLKEWQSLRGEKERASRCLEAVRWALDKEAICIPYSYINYKGNFAIQNFAALARDPGRFQWKQVHSPLTVPCLVYFGGVGFLPWRLKFAGHVAIYLPSTGIHYSNNNYPMNKYWTGKLKGAFVPKD